MKTNIRPIPPERVAAWLARHPDASPVEWDEDGGHFDGVRLADGQTYRVSTCYTPTDAERAAAEAAAATAADREAKRQAIRSDVVAVLDDLKAGTLTFGNASRDAAAKKLARACRFLLTGDTSE